MKSVVIDMLVDANSTKGHVVLTPEQLTEEIIMLLSAGNDTTSDALIIGIWQICRHSEVLQQLEDELRQTFPNVRDHDAITYDNVQNLPYLVSSKLLFARSWTDAEIQNAVIKEILRISNPLPGRLPRLVPEDGYEFYGRHVPAGVNQTTPSHALPFNDL
jgi:cytochrome P450